MEGFEPPVAAWFSTCPCGCYLAFISTRCEWVAMSSGRFSFCALLARCQRNFLHPLY